MSKLKLTLNEDVNCKQCGKGGACKVGDSGDYGICLECANLNLECKNRMKFGPKTRGKATDLISNLLEGYQKQIEKTYSEATGKLDIGMKVTLESAGDLGIKVSAKISFVESKIDETVFDVIDEEQMAIEFPDNSKDKKKK